MAAVFAVVDEPARLERLAGATASMSAAITEEALDPVRGSASWRRDNLGAVVPEATTTTTKPRWSTRTATASEHIE